MSHPTTELSLTAAELQAYLAESEPKPHTRRKVRLPRPEPPRNAAEIERQSAASLAWIESWGNEFEVDQRTKRGLERADDAADGELAGLSDD